MVWLIFLILCVLFPVAIYCFFLALLNRRRQPTLIPGSWDFAALLFALSGFLLIAGPLILAALNQTLRSLWLRSESDSLPALGESWWYVRVTLWALYFAAIAAGSVFLLWKRGRLTSVYNVEVAALDQALAGALNRLPVKWTRVGNRVLVAFPASPDGLVKENNSSGIPQTAIISPGTLPGEREGSDSSDAKATLQAPEILSQQSAAVLTLDSFPAMRHVTLQWPRQAGPWRREIETELANSLLDVHTRDNPAALWLLSIGSTLLCLIFFALALLVVVSFLPPPG